MTSKKKMKRAAGRKGAHKKYDNRSRWHSHGLQYQVLWHSQSHSSRTKSARVVKEYALEVVRETERIVPKPVRAIVADLRPMQAAYLVAVDEPWIACRAPSSFSPASILRLNACWFHREADLRDELMWEVGVCIAEEYLDVVHGLARVGYHTLHHGVRELDATKIISEQDRQHRRVERLVREHDLRDGHHVLAPAVAETWGLKRPQRARLQCLRCTDECGTLPAPLKPPCKPEIETSAEADDSTSAPAANDALPLTEVK